MNDASEITTTTTNLRASRFQKTASHDNPLTIVVRGGAFPERLCKVDLGCLVKTLKDREEKHLRFRDRFPWEGGEPLDLIDFGSGGLMVPDTRVRGNQWEDGGYVYYGVADGPGAWLGALSPRRFGGQITLARRHE